MTRVGRYDALALTAAIWFLAKLLRYAVPPLFATFGRTFGASTATLGAAFSVMMLCYAAMQFPAGVLADRFGPVRVVAAGALVASAAALLVAAAGGFPALVAAMVLVGAGTGVHKTVAVTLLPRVYDARTGRALGAFDTAGAMGGAVAPVAVVGLLARPWLSWRALFVAAAAAGVVAAVLFVWRVSARLPARPSKGAGAAGGGVSRYASAFADRRLAGFVGVTVLLSVAYNGVVAFLPLYLTARVGLDASTAGLLYGGLFLVSLVQPVTGDAADRLGALPVTVALVGLATAGLAGLLVADGPVVAAAAVAAVGAGNHGFRPVRGAYLVAAAPGDVAGGTLGVARTAIMAAGALSPAAVGLVASTWGFQLAFGALLAASAAGVALAATLAAGTARATRGV
ncbi:MAG: MFS transporter [Halobacteriaceae archaeon]